MVAIEWRPAESSAMRADMESYGTGKILRWHIAVYLVSATSGRPATGTDAAATLSIKVAFDKAGRWEAEIAPGQDEGERPANLAGADGGYQAAQEAIANEMANYAKKAIGKRRGYVAVGLGSPQGGQAIIVV